MEENVNVNEPINAPESEVSTSNSFKDIVKNLIINGAKVYKNHHIKNMTITDCDTYVRVAITLTDAVPGYVSHDNGTTYEKGMTKVIFTSLFAITAMLRENEELAWLATPILQKEQDARENGENIELAIGNLMNVIFCGSTIDILQRHYNAGDAISNPYSTRTDKQETVYDHDVYINDIINVSLGKTGAKMADRLADKILGF